MNDMTVIILLLLVGSTTTTLLGLRFSSRYKCSDTFDQWRRSNGKMLPDYDAEQDFIDKYAK